MSEPKFDHQGFSTALRGIILARGVSLRSVAREIGVAQATMSRMFKSQTPPDVETLAKLADWSGLSVDAFIRRRQTTFRTGDVIQASVALEDALRTLRRIVGDSLWLP